MKNDMRVKLTKKMIRDAFLNKLTKKSLREITVKEVCEAAEINRATFYKYYRDCYDLVAQISDGMLKEYEASLDRIDYFEIESLTGAILDIIDSNSDLCDAVIFEHKDDSLLKKMISIAHGRCIGEWRRFLRKADEAEIEMLFCCLSYGLTQVIMNFYGMYSRETITKFAESIVRSAMVKYTANGKLPADMTL